MGVKSINWPEAIYQFGIVEKSWRKYVQFCPIMSKVNLLFESWTKISWTKLDEIGQNWTWPPYTICTKRQFVQSVNYHLYGCEVMPEDSEDLAFLNHVISRDQNISCNHSPLPRPGCD